LWCQSGAAFAQIFFDAFNGSIIWKKMCQNLACSVKAVALNRKQNFTRNVNEIGQHLMWHLLYPGTPLHIVHFC
jgi:hypothetical protein